MSQQTASQQQLILPNSVATPTDVSHMLRELDAVDNFLLDAKIRTPGTPMQLPRTTQALQELAESNRFNLLQESDRANMHKWLEYIYKNAPVLHMSFASDPSPVFVNKLITWVRANLHFAALIQIGLQPNIAAGCALRGPNKYFDFSIRKHLMDKKPELLDAIREVKA